MKNRLLILVALTSAANNIASASEVFKLEKVQFTATRSEREEKFIPASTSTITKDEIKFERMFNLSEPLQEVSGVNAETRNNGYDVRLIIRGGGLNAPFGIRQINILLDGVPITDPDGLTRLDFVNPLLVDQIDIVKGPNSTMYGANAIGGVVNFVTKPVWEVRGQNYKVGFGNYNTRLLNATYSSKYKDKFFYYIDYTRQQSDSFREWNKYSSDRVSFKTGYILNETSSLESFFNYSKADLQLPGAVTKEQFERNPYVQYPENNWIRSGRYSEIYFMNIKCTGNVSDSFSIKPIFYVQKWSHYHPVTGQINEADSKVYGTDITSEFKHKISWIPGTLVFGFQLQKDDYNSERFEYRDIYRDPRNRNLFYTLTDRKGELLRDQNNDILKYGFFLQETLRPSDKVLIDAGIRYDTVEFDLKGTRYKEMNIRDGTYQTLQRPVYSEQKFDFKEWSPRLGILYSLDKKTNLFFSFSKGFQTPQWGQLEENPNLRNTVATQYEIGLKSSDRDIYNINLSMFYIKSKNEIVRSIQDNISTFLNAGETSKKGLEIDGRYKMLDSDVAGTVYIGGAYTYSDFIYERYFEVIRFFNPATRRTEQVLLDRSNNRIEYIPKHKYTVSVYYFHPSGFRAKVDTNTWGEYYIDAANSEKYKGYEFVTNVAVHYEKKHYDIGISVYNLFDKKYSIETTKSWTSPTQGVVRMVPGAPRTYFASLNIRF